MYIILYIYRLYYEDSVWIKKGEGGNFDISIGAYDGAEICELVGCVLLYNINKIMDPNNHGTLLYYEDSVWIKKGEGGNFDVSIGAYDGAEICELVGCVLLYNINKIMDPNNHGLYRDDGLIIVDKSTPRKCDGIRKKLYKLFDDFGFRLDVTTDLKITDYLDITLNLYSGTVSPFRKRNQDQRYVNRGSNHPIQVFKHVPKGIEHRLSNNSSNREIFERTKQEYEEALKK